ncbi:MAG: hypothetical protein MUP58_01365, partial [Candidatus Nanohaloarchaeota archaeon QJJ-9]|nr:hypothetical protein [Candidatus Nanohaloarchaeota archaeon QJJ-9]
LVLNPDRSPVAEFPGNVSLNGNYIQDLGGIADCGPNQYITGDGSCRYDQDTSTPDNQTLSEVLDEGNSAESSRITGLADPIDAQDAATKSWVDDNDDNTNAQTECSGSQYLTGGGNCRYDSDSTVNGCNGCLSIGNEVSDPGGLADGDDYEPDTNAATKCSGSDTYLAGDGTCQPDSSGTGGDGYLPEDPATSDLDINGNSIENANTVKTSQLTISGVGTIKGDSYDRFNIERPINMNDWSIVNAHQFEGVTARLGYIMLDDSLADNVDYNIRSPQGEIDISSKVNMKGNRITNLATPTNPSDAATKEYVDNNAGKGSIAFKNCYVVDYLDSSNNCDAGEVVTDVGYWYDSVTSITCCDIYIK